jgi:hypothetical protein
VSDEIGIDRCPTDVVLSAFADGTLDLNERQDVLVHIARCSECGDVIAAAVEFLRQPDLSSTETSFRPKWWLQTAASIAAVCVAVLAWRMLVPPDPLGPLRRAAATSPTRPVEGWLGGFDHRPFAQPRSGQTKTMPMEVLAVADELQRTTADSPQSLHARGIAALFTGDPGLAESLLERAAAASPDNALYWSDLAAAEIALGTASQSLGPFEQAVNAADRALCISPVLGTAHFNRAAALEHLGYHDAAARSYRAALPTSPPPPWRLEILTRLD